MAPTAPAASLSLLLLDTLNALGVIFDKQAEAEAQIAKLDKAMTDLKKEAATAGSSLIDRDSATGRAVGAAQKVLDNEPAPRPIPGRSYLDPVNWYPIGGGLTALQASADQIMKAFAKK
jgi:ABC-type enterochelin transport system substrate-binding protein